MKQLLDIFLVFFRIGLFTIGGGYAMLPIIQRDVVEGKAWMTDLEFLDTISLANSLPGPLATNCATFVGYRLKRVPGAIAAVLGAITPSVCIILCVAAVFQDLMGLQVIKYVFLGIRPAVAALICFSIIRLGKSARILHDCNWLVTIFGFLALAVWDIHPVIIVVSAAVYGIFFRDHLLNFVGAVKSKKGGDDQ